jgi:hypothetical protein
MNSSDNIVINPLTQRPIKRGGRVFKRLIAHGYTLSDFYENGGTPKYKIKEVLPIVDNEYKSDDNEYKSDDNEYKSDVSETSTINYDDFDSCNEDEYVNE